MKLSTSLAAIASLLAALTPAALRAVEPLSLEVRGAPRKPNASDEWFASGTIPELRITVSAADMQKLRERPREYVKGTLHEDGKTEYKEVGVKLKGAAGSFRNVDDRPAFTINSNKYTKKQTFHGMDKFHLNNSVQDDSYLCELICSDLFLAAGLPAPRVSHARVWLNDRDLGIYVLKEGVDEVFLRRHFARPNGNLYDGGFCQDLDGNMEKDEGDGPDDKSDVKAIIDACRDGDQTRRWARVAETVNIEAFLTYTALELMTCHWDGYARNRNNYRFYIEPKTKQAYFIPQGMDQMFGDPNFSIVDAGNLVCGAVFSNPEWKARYRMIVKDLAPLFSPPDKLLARIDSVHTRLKPVIAKMNPQQAEHHSNRVNDLKNRITARAKVIEAQKVTREPMLAVFTPQGESKLADWYPGQDAGGTQQAEVELPGRGKAYSILCPQPGQFTASWRKKVILPKGNYKLVAVADAKDLVPLDDNLGAGLRISGGQRSPANQVMGTATGKTLEFEFEVPEPTREVELVAELKAKQGQVWFLLDSLKLVRK